MTKPEEIVNEEPDYIAQTYQNHLTHMSWYNLRKREAQREGCTFFRYSYHPQDIWIALIEGWKKQPADQGEPRFQIIGAIPSDGGSP